MFPSEVDELPEVCLLHAVRLNKRHNKIMLNKCFHHFKIFLSRISESSITLSGGMLNI